MSYDLVSYATKLQNGEIKMMPIIHFQAGAANTDYIAIDYAYLVEVMAKMVNYNYGTGAAALIADYAVDPDSKVNKFNALLLVHSFLSQCLGVANINSVDNKMLARYLRYSTDSVFENDKVTAQFSAVNFVISRLEAYFTTDINLMKKLISFGDLSQATQVAFGMKSKEYFVDKKIKQTYYMTSSQISNRPTFE
jgi:hypothetical protein